MMKNLSQEKLIIFFEFHPATKPKLKTYETSHKKAILIQEKELW
jgi:hypothetical protein